MTKIPLVLFRVQNELLLAHYFISKMCYFIYFNDFVK